MAHPTKIYQFPNVTNQTPLTPNGCFSSQPSKNFKIIAAVILLICSLIGNLLVVFAFYRNRTLNGRALFHSEHGHLWSNDSCGLSTIEDKLTRTTMVSGLLMGVLSSLLCKSAHVVWNASIIVSMFSMVTIAADRFRAILFPMKPALFSRNKFRLLTIVVAAIWIASSAIVAPFLRGSNLVKHGNKMYCLSGFHWTNSSHQWGVMVITYIFIFCLTSICCRVNCAVYKYSDIPVQTEEQSSLCNWGTSKESKTKSSNYIYACNYSDCFLCCLDSTSCHGFSFPFQEQHKITLLFVLDATRCYPLRILRG